MGGTALLAGIILTPAIALLVRELHCDGGIVISASHNPPEYNGIKLFDGQGFKLPDAVEDEIEAYLAAGGHRRTSCRTATRWAWRCRWTTPASCTSRTPCPRWPARASTSRASGGARRRPWRILHDQRRGAAPSGRRGGFDQRGLRRHRHQRAVRLHPSRAVARARGRAPMRALRTTATPTASCLWTRTATRSTATWWRPCALSTCTSAGCLPAAPPCPPSCATSRLSHALRDAGIELNQTKVGDRYVLEAMRRGRLRPGRRAERPYDLPRAQLHRRRLGDRPCSSWPLAGVPVPPSRMSPAS